MTFDDFVTVSQGMSLQMAAIDQHVGGRLRKLRRNSDMSVDRLAAEIKQPAPRVLDYEQGATRISSETLVRLCRVFNVNPSYFFNEFGAGE